jgi:hypothetical protein
MSKFKAFDNHPIFLKKTLGFKFAYAAIVLLLFWNLYKNKHIRSILSRLLSGFCLLLFVSFFKFQGTHAFASSGYQEKVRIGFKFKGYLKFLIKKCWFENI